jgi:hypothetical protein
MRRFNDEHAPGTLVSIEIVFEIEQRKPMMAAGRDSSPNARVGSRRRLRIETKDCVRACALMSRFTIYSGRTLEVEAAAPA